MWQLWEGFFFWNWGRNLLAVATESEVAQALERGGDGMAGFGARVSRHAS